MLFQRKSAKKPGGSNTRPSCPWLGRLLLLCSSVQYILYMCSLDSLCILYGYNSLTIISYYRLIAKVIKNRQILYITVQYISDISHSD
jgi:hypothetical protein